jgi:hypothetical protein
VQANTACDEQRRRDIYVALTATSGRIVSDFQTPEDWQNIKAIWGTCC